MVMYTTSINSNSWDTLIGAISLLITFAIIYPYYLLKVYRKIKGWNIYSLFIAGLLIANGLAIAYTLPEIAWTCILGTVVFLASILLLVLSKNNTVRKHLIIVETYIFFLIANIVVYYTT